MFLGPVDHDVEPVDRGRAVLEGVALVLFTPLFPQSLEDVTEYGGRGHGQDPSAAGPSEPGRGTAPGHWTGLRLVGGRYVEGPGPVGGRSGQGPAGVKRTGVPGGACAAALSASGGTTPITG